MPRPDRLNLTWEDVQKEIASWPDANAKHSALDTLTEEQKKILCGFMRSGKRMLEISTWWQEQGWEGGSPNTLRRMFRALEKQGY